MIHAWSKPEEIHIISVYLICQSVLSERREIGTQQKENNVFNLGKAEEIMSITYNGEIMHHIIKD